MKGSDYVVIALTFITGVFAGMYFYVTVYAPDYEKQPEPIVVEETSFLLAGEEYGVCQRTLASCPVFTLYQDRAYEYTVSYHEDEDQREPVVGQFNKDAYKALLQAVSVANMNALSREGGRCESAADGVDYRYRLIYEGKEYMLDTCGTQFTSSALAKQFAALWPMVATSTSAFESFSEFNVKDTLEGQIDAWFQYDDR